MHQANNLAHEMKVVPDTVRVYQQGLSTGPRWHGVCTCLDIDMRKLWHGQSLARGLKVSRDMRSCTRVVRHYAKVY